MNETPPEAGDEPEWRGIKRLKRRFSTDGTDGARSFDFEYRNDEGGEDWFAITTPVYLSDGDAIRLYVRETDDGAYRITDTGQMYGMCYTSGFTDADGEWYEAVTSALKRRYDLEAAKHEVEVITPEADLEARFIETIQAMNTISDTLSVWRQVQHDD